MASSSGFSPPVTRTLLHSPVSFSILSRLRSSTPRRDWTFEDMRPLKIECLSSRPLAAQPPHRDLSRPPNWSAIYRTRRLEQLGYSMTLNPLRITPTRDEFQGKPGRDKKDPRFPMKKVPGQWQRTWWSVAGPQVK